MLATPPASSSDDGHSADNALSAAADRMLDVATALLASRAAGQHQQLPTLAMSFLLRRNYMSLSRLLDDAMASGSGPASNATSACSAVQSALRRLFGRIRRPDAADHGEDDSQRSRPR